MANEYLFGWGDPTVSEVDHRTHGAQIPIDPYKTETPGYYQDANGNWYQRFRGDSTVNAPYLPGATGMGRATYTATNDQGVPTAFYGSEGAPSRIAALRDSSSADSNAYNWNGMQDGAAFDREIARRWENTVANRAAPTVDLTADTQSRGLMLAGARGYESMLNGTGPSLANSQLRQGIDRSTAIASSTVAHASPSNQAAATRAGLLAANASAVRSANAATAQRFDETSKAGAGLGAAYGNMYNADLTGARRRADLELQNRAANDEAAAGFAQNRINVGRAQMGAQAERQRQRQRLQEQWSARSQAQYQAERAQQERRDAMWKGAVVAAGTAAGTALGGPGGAVLGGGLAGAAVS